MAENRSHAARKNGPGKQFQKGQSGNPGGYSSCMRERRKQFAEKLDEAFRVGDRDLFVEAVLRGVDQLDPTCMKLTASYRFGPPEQHIELTGADGGPLAVRAEELSDDHLAAVIAQGVKK